MMPRGGAETRAEGLATLERLSHELFVRDEIGELLERLAPEVADLDPDSDEACLVAVTRRDWEKARRVPTELRGEMTKLASEGMEAWAVARENDDYTSFRPWLDRALELKHRYIACFPEANEPYDALLDDFEPGMRTDGGAPGVRAAPAGPPRPRGGGRRGRGRAVSVAAVPARGTARSVGRRRPCVRRG